MLASVWAALQERIESPVYAILAAVLTLAVLLTFAMGSCGAPVPATVTAQVKAHEQRESADSSAAAAVTTARVSAARRDSQLVAAATRVADHAQHQHQVANDAGAAAASSTSAADSATAYAAAYAARTLEASVQDSLIDALLADTTVKAQQIVLADSGTTLARTDVRSSDSLVAALVPLTAGGDGCRVARIFACPSRKHVAVVTVVATLAVVVFARPAGHALLAHLRLQTLPRARAGLQIRLAGVGWP